MTTIGELKFACPVCHQHIVCDLSAAGRQIECPTCFRPVVVPKSPSGNHGKIILHARQPKPEKVLLVPKTVAISSSARKRTWWWAIASAAKLLLARERR
jgi:hypothetical protein